MVSASSTEPSARAPEDLLDVVGVRSVADEADCLRRVVAKHPDRLLGARDRRDSPAVRKELACKDAPEVASPEDEQRRHGYAITRRRC